MIKQLIPLFKQLSNDIFILQLRIWMPLGVHLAAFLLHLWVASGLPLAHLRVSIFLPFALWVSISLPFAPLGRLWVASGPPPGLGFRG